MVAAPESAIMRSAASAALGLREWAVAPSDRPIWFRAAVGLVILTALGLSGCGRKGPLEPPPSARITNPDGTTAPDTGPIKPSRHFVLDPLI